MASWKTLLSLGLFLCAEIITAADQDSKAANVRWSSLDFKTLLVWTTKTRQHSYSVRFSRDEGDWDYHPECKEMSGSIFGTTFKCDMSEELRPFDRSYTADILTENENVDDYDYSHDESPHTESPPFNPYRDSNISVVQFSVKAVNESTIVLNITDTLTSVHDGSKQLTIRDIFKKDLKYQITYRKSENTGQKYHISDSSVAEVSKLDPGTSYCFSVAAYIPTRPKSTQLGTLSSHQCEQTYGDLNPMHELSMGAWVGLIFVLLTVFIIVVTVTVLCCRNRQQRNKTPHTTQSQTSVPV